MLTLAALGHLAAPWLAKIPGMISDELKTRGTLRVRREEARLAIRVEEQRVALTGVLRRAQHDHEITLVRLQSEALHYPLGIPGRLRESGSLNRPAVLISPPPGAAISSSVGAGIDEIAYDWMRGAPRINRYADLLSGAFVRDNGVSRAIRGLGEAKEIAIAEFPSRPAVLIYLERHSTGMTAFAYLSGLFPTVDGETGFPIRVAKFLTAGDPVASPVASPQDGDLPTWQLINLSGWPGPRDEVIAAVIGWFALSVLDTYWLLHGVAGTGLLATAFPQTGNASSASNAGQPPRQAQPFSEVSRSDADGTDQFLLRLDSEMRGLAGSGFGLGEVLEFGEGQVALLTSKGDLLIAFVVGEDFPVKPPLVLALGEHGEQRFDIDEGTWTPDRTLLEIAESLL